jgi:hypothetical protein
MSTSSQVPAGLQQASGKALQVFEDFESERLLPEHRAMEAFVIETAKLTCYAWRSMLKEAKASREAGDEDEDEDAAADSDGTENPESNQFFVEYRAKGSLERIALKDLVDDKRIPTVTVFPVSQLARTPAAKFGQLMDMLNAKAITIEQFKRLYELPDLEAENEIDTADCTAVDWAVDQMIFEGKPQVPDAFYNFTYAKERCRKWVNHLRQYEVPEKRLQLLRNFLAFMERKEQEQAAAAAPAPTAGGPGPMGPMGPPPGTGPSGPPGLPPPPPPMMSNEPVPPMAV